MDSGDKPAGCPWCVDCQLYQRDLYVVGGVDPEKTLASTLAYDPATDKWTEKAPMSTARHGLAAVSLVTRYVIGGGPQPGGSAGSLNEIFHVNGGR